MAHNVSNEYKQVIYSGDARNKIKILFNNVELQDADRYCEKLTVKSRIVPNGAKIFNLNNFISKEADLILHDIDTNIIQDQVSISIGTLVGNSYEYVPIGIFNIQDQPTNDKNKTTIKLRDNSVKFDFNYNAQPLIEENGGSATKLQILQDICSKAGVTCNISSFIGYVDDIGVYDNTITAREYISRIAEQAGRIATINRSGELIFVDLNNLTTWEIPIEIVEKYENGTKYKIGRVVYEDGIVRYETPTSNDDTLFLDGSNNYINGELVKEQASSNNNHYYLENTGDSELAYLKLEGKTTQETRSGKNLLKNTNVNSGDNNYWQTYSTFDEATRTVTRSTTGTTEVFIYHRVGLNSNTTYTLSLYAKSNGYVSSMEFYMFNNSIQGVKYKSAMSLTTEFQKYTWTFTTSSGIDYSTNAVIRIDNNGSTTSGTESILTVKDVMLEEGSTATEYEDYGISPSPDYPSELVSVGYENLLPSNNTSQTISGVTFTHNEDGSITINGTSTAQITYRINASGSELTLNKGTYTLSLKNNLVSGLAVYGWHSSGTLFSEIYNGNNKYTFTFDDNYSTVRFSIAISASKTIDNLTIYPQLIKGNVEHNYIPFSKYGIEITTTGKNLFEPRYQINGTSIACVNATLVLDEDTFKLTATGKDMYFGQVRGQGQTYTETLGNLIDVSKYSAITFYNTNPIITANYITSYDENKVSLGYQPFYSQSATYVIPSNVKYISYRFGYAGAVSGTTYENKVIIEANNKSTGYEKYKENTYLYVLDNPLRSIGDTKDLLYIKNGMLYVDRKIGSVVYNGSEPNWAVNGNVFYRTISDKIKSKTKMYSNYFSYINVSWPQLTNYTMTDDATTNTIFIKDEDYSSVSTFKTWLSTHNTEIQYVLATPYTEELGEVQMPSTYESTTHINIDSNIDTNTYIQYKENKTQLEAILQNTNQFSIDSLKTGKILGNPAIDSYDLIQIHDKSRNLFDFSIWKNVTLNRSSSSATIDTSNNTLTINNLLGEDVFTNSGMSIAGQTILSEYRKYLIPVKPNTKYTISFTTGGTPSNSATVNSSYYSLINENFVVNYAGAFGSIKVPEYHKWTLTTNETTKYLGIRFGCRTEKVTISYSNIQIEEGTIATDYIPFKDETYKTLATNDLVYTGVLTNTFDTQIGEEAKEQNVFINGEDTFKKWARTTIDNIEGSISLQAGQINETNGRIDQTTLTIEKDGALLNVLANNSNIDVQYDNAGNPLSGEVREVTTTTGFKFNAEGMTIEDTSSNFKALHRNTGTYYKEGDNIVGQYTKDGSKQKDLELFGVYYYGKNDIDDTPMFVAQLYTDENGEECFGHFINRGD